MENTIKKVSLPKGKLNVRFRQMRGVWQCFAGNTYLDCASGDTPDEAIEAIRYCYVLPEGSEITTHWSDIRKLKTVIGGDTDLDNLSHNTQQAICDMDSYIPGDEW